MLKILVFSIVSAMIYGVLHDMVTARICVEYFTIGHAPFINSTDPTLVALAWGTAATWWVGLALGIPLAVAGRIGSRPKLVWWDMVRPMSVLLAVSACCALLAGVTGYILGSRGLLVLPNHPLLQGEVGVRFEAVHWAHIASYLVGSLGGVVLILYIWRRRYVLYRESIASSTV